MSVTSLRLRLGGGPGGFVVRNIRYSRFRDIVYTAGAFDSDWTREVA